MIENYRKLTSAEITQMISQGSRADNWLNIEVGDGFCAQNIVNCSFCGTVRIGATNGSIADPEGIERPCGIYNAELLNCSVGDNVFICNIGSYIANYTIGDGAFISGVEIMETTTDSTFGNGVEVATVNEGGGREVPMYNDLTAQVAYIIAMYRHRDKTIEALRKMIADYCESIRSSLGRVGNHSVITGCGTISNVNLGDYGVIQEATIMNNGTINSCQESPSFVGAGVKAYNFILAPGAKVDNGAMLNRCFVGESCHIDYGYTAADSLFFANCECANGEACSIFAGPFTVSHHKSSLLIAGLFSFFNAGSGSNQSNHLFKTGAVHQGIHERGCKFASDAYVVLPAREGAFTVIMGRHYKHHDTQHFPFSYLVEESGYSLLIPAFNLRSFGSVRDIAKWPKRDKRRGKISDVVNFEKYNPYIGQKFVQAIKISTDLLSKDGVDMYTYERVKIKSVALRRGLQLYELTLEATLASILAKGEGAMHNVKNIEHWADLSGMFAPMSVVNELLDRVDASQVTDIAVFDKEVRAIGQKYNDYSYLWAVNALAGMIGREPLPQDIAKMIERGRNSEMLISEMNQEDAKRDANELMTTGYGIDCLDPDQIEADFKAVRKI